MTNRSALVVEDDRTTALLFKALCENFGFSPTVVHTLQEGLEAARTQFFEIALVDLHLPDGDGVPLLKCFADSNFSTFVIATSASRSVETYSHLFSEPERYAFLQKPFSYSDFYQLLNTRDAIEVVLPTVQMESAALKEVLVEYIDSLEGEYSALQVLMQKGAYSELAKLAHRTSSGAMFGFPELATLCKKLNKAALAECEEDMKLALDRIGVLVPQIVSGKQYLN